MAKNECDGLWHNKGYCVSATWHLYDSLDECARKTDEFLRGIADLFPNWFPFFNSTSFKTAMKPLYEIPTLDELKRTVVAGRDQHLIDSVAEAQGSSIIFSNDNAKGKSTFIRLITININCGAAPGRSNDVRIQFPPAFEGNEDIVNEEMYTKVFDLVVRCWNPRRGFLAPNLLRDALNDTLTHIGWLTYISNRIHDIPSLPEWAKIIPMEDRGYYIQSTEKLLDVNSLDDLKRVKALHELLSIFLEPQYLLHE